VYAKFKIRDKNTIRVPDSCLAVHGMEICFLISDEFSIAIHIGSGVQEKVAVENNPVPEEIPEKFLFGHKRCINELPDILADKVGWSITQNPVCNFIGVLNSSRFIVYHDWVSDDIQYFGKKGQ
jgi:hypothetical protein